MCQLFALVTQLEPGIQGVGYPGEHLVDTANTFAQDDSSSLTIDSAILEQKKTPPFLAGFPGIPLGDTVV
jgi:hypothetical protein